MLVLLYSLGFPLFILIVLAGFKVFILFSIPAAAVPPISAILLINFPKSFARAEEKAISNESANVISYMIMGMYVNPSLESAVSFASHARGVLSNRLREVSWRVLTRESRDVFSSLLKFTSDLSALNEPLKHAVHLITSATFERSREGMERLLEKANEIVLKGVQDRVNQYVSSLSVPVMILFSLGIILPVMLFTLLLMTSLTTPTDAGLVGTGMLGMKTDLWMVAVLLLLVFPMVTSFYARSILSRNPVLASSELHINPSRNTVIFLSLWGVVLVPAITYTPGYGILLSLVLPPCIFLAVNFREGHKRWERVEKRGDGLVEGLFQMGNRMLSGAGFERAFRDTSKSLEDSCFGKFAKKSCTGQM